MRLALETILFFFKVNLDPFRDWSRSRITPLWQPKVSREMSVTLKEYSWFWQKKLFGIASVTAIK